jgi:hypothetical protein
VTDVDTQPSGPQCPTCTRLLRETELGQPLCGACVRAMAGWLAELPHQLVVLRGSRQREVGEQQRVAGSRTAPLPGRLDVLNLIGPGSPGDVRDQAGDQTGPLPITTVLGSWARLITEERGLRGPRGRSEEHLADYLARHLDWAAGQPWAPELHAELQQMMRVIRSITRVRPRTKAIPRPCPRETCQALALVATDHQQYVECTACGGLYTPGELMDDAPAALARLARQQQETAA